MTEDEAVAIVRRHVESHFPKTCNLCGRRFETLLEYLQNTRHVGNPVSYDAGSADMTPAEPIGTYSVARCSCGTALAVGSDGISLPTMWRLMWWARGEAKRLAITMPALLARIRDRIDRQVFAEAEAVNGKAEPGNAP
jgi:hypothetical protein